MADYKRKTKGKTFGHIEAWEIVRKNDKWLEQPIVGQTSSSNSEKRKKSSESSNDNVETIIPDLNEDTTPTQKNGAKRALLSRPQVIVLLRLSKFMLQRNHNYWRSR